jgi:hypothetical protein
MTFPEHSTQMMMNGISRFLRIGPDHGVNNVVLEGPINDVPTKFTGFIALFPLTHYQNNHMMAIIDTTPTPRSRSECYDSTAALTITDRIRNLNIPDDPAIQRGLERILALQGMPSIVVALGTTVQTQEERIVMFFINGVGPERALSMVQDKIKNRRATLQ